MRSKVFFPSKPGQGDVLTCGSAAGGDFDAKIGTAEAPAPDHLRNGLWAASQLLAGSKNAYKRVLVFSTDANPAGSGPRAETYKCVPLRALAGSANCLASPGAHTWNTVPVSHITPASCHLPHCT